MPEKNLLKAERVAYILADLQARYPKPPIPLDHKDPYTLLIAVLLSAQCTDERVNQVTPSLWKLADNPFDMAKQSVEDIKQIIRPCGLSPQKSKAIKKLSEILVADYDGIVPEDMDALETLPGVGHKTAGVVMAQAFDVPAFPVDTHIHRLAQRWGLTNGKNVAQTEKDLKRLFPKECWNDLHLQFIYYGREFCTARGCDGTVCPMCTTCYPNRKRPKVVKKP
ncbi:endonuclease III [Pseudoalteromonas luteoviolacea]|uniref:Endonuclease III n=1 Tax=Pseudoalteromonas luteoviolacea S4054 TaxID=1129367 RepID=A0A0F6AAA7_9GAMM|nr:endonuclease III [Pseudoalteromonas luteoviolacea]AOT06889.1 endonuclease III [Pseudoalteromonas luteoviolacea]AOT11807.1 endonuclease III [Pseudoalteromonas luteoviolacea]AOT16719.1 endonuclease III [Pseudoalteromonas luteoviolacea]KKE82786.1 endonuclease III [Pseudoalteromonas luteoviolacea S4054]KZN72997.1 endonuclease III [Pseudoalteromonas luteoviolacea S4047-1]